EKRKAHEQEIEASESKLPQFMQEAMETLHRITEIDMEDLESMYSDFVDQIKEELHDIHVLLMENKYEDVKRSAHKLKGSTGNLQLHSLHEQAVRL
ncbi:hypothetical protein ADUPG1_004838, partial [Aduncisulcus paluster]